MEPLNQDEYREFSLPLDEPMFNLTDMQTLEVRKLQVSVSDIIQGIREGTALLMKNPETGEFEEVDALAELEDIVKSLIRTNYVYKLKIVSTLLKTFHPNPQRYDNLPWRFLVYLYRCIGGHPISE